MNEVIISNYNEKVKQIILGIRDYAFSVSYDYYPSDAISLIEMSKQKAEYGLADGLRQFFKTEVDEDRRLVISRVHLPYVRNAEVEGLVQDAMLNHTRIMQLKQTNANLNFKISKFNALPWYKRIWAPIS